MAALMEVLPCFVVSIGPGKNQGGKGDRRRGQEQAGQCEHALLPAPWHPLPWCGHSHPVAEPVSATEWTVLQSRGKDIVPV